MLEMAIGGVLTRRKTGSERVHRRERRRRRRVGGVGVTLLSGSAVFGWEASDESDAGSSFVLARCERSSARSFATLR
jgi:hypothetical protein